jgi:hypothetical protein
VKCGKSLRPALPVLCLLLFFTAEATLSAQPTQTPEPPSSPPSAEPGTPPSLPTDTAPGPSLSELWAQLKSELIASDADWQRVSSLLDALQIEADGLRFSLTLSTELLEQSEAAREAERQAALEAMARADAAERSRDIWRAVGLTAGGLLIADIAIRLIELFK